MALVYATGGSELLIEAWVVDMASKVVTPRATLAGTWNEIGNSFYKKYLSLNYLQSKMEKWLLPNEKQNFFFANNLWNEKVCFLSKLYLLHDTERKKQHHAYCKDLSKMIKMMLLG